MNFGQECTFLWQFNDWAQPNVEQKRILLLHCSLFWFVIAYVHMVLNFQGQLDTYLRSWGVKKIKLIHAIFNSEFHEYHRDTNSKPVYFEAFSNWHPQILRPRALFYRTDCTGSRSKFLNTNPPWISLICWPFRTSNTYSSSL